MPLRVNRALVETDLVLTVTAAESVLHGGPGALVGGEARRRCERQPPRRSSRRAARPAGSSARAGAAARGPRPAPRRVARAQPSAAHGPLRGYPYEAEALARSPARRCADFSCCPAGPARLLRAYRRELTAVAAFAGPPSVAHAEALLRGIARRSTPLDRPLDAIVIAMPWKTTRPARAAEPDHGRDLALGLALRLWRDAFPVMDDGTAILLHRSRALRAHDPGRTARSSMRSRRATDVARGQRGRGGYAGARGLPRRPRLPSAPALRRLGHCRPALDRLGAVVVAGCRDPRPPAPLGFVPTHGVGARSRWPTAGAGARPRSATCSARPTSRSVVGGEAGLVARPVGLAHLLVALRSFAGAGERDRARSRSRSRGSARRAPSARSARRAASASPAR